MIKISLNNEQQQKELRACFARVFSSKDGKQVMEYLKKTTIEKPVLNGSSSKFDAGINQGKCNLYFLIKRLKEQGENYGK